MSSIQSKISVLIQLAKIDGDFSDDEKDIIYIIGKANGLTPDNIDDLIDNPVPLPPISTLSESNKFEYLFHLVQIMKVDSQVYLSEINFCEDLAEKLGFKRSVISKLSSKIYSNPEISSDLEILKREVQQYLH